MNDLKGKTIRGGLARLVAQGVNFLLRVVSLMVLARLLGPQDFGLVGMVTVFTGVLTLFRDFGLSAAAIQRGNITKEQISTLFWINFLVGIFLAIVMAAGAPAIASFYHEPRLFGISAVLALGFIFNAVGIQHSVLLQREMRFTALAIINTVGLVVGTSIAILAAKAGYGYWSLVAMTIAAPLASSIGFWLCSGWIPGMPQRHAGIRSLIRFGGTLTFNGLVLYIANNFEKVLLARFWGAEALGIYGRAYQLVNIPTENLNSAVGEVAFSALSRVQDDAQRLKSYFLKGYSIVLALTLPITAACALFADDLVRVMLGPKWASAAPIFRLLAPTVFVFAVANPLSWLVLSLGMVRRSFKMTLVISPILIGAYVLGLSHGPKGVAFAYSTVLLLWVIPVIFWSIRGTTIAFSSILGVIARPLASSILAGAFAFASRMLYGHLLPPLSRLFLELGVLFFAFLGILMFGTGERAAYFDLISAIKTDGAAAERQTASA